MPHHHRRRAAMLTALLRSTAFAACGNIDFGGAFSIPKDWSGSSPEEYARWLQCVDACNPLANDASGINDYHGPSDGRRRRQPAARTHVGTARQGSSP